MLHIVYQPFKYIDIPPDIWFPSQSDNGLMQQKGQYLGMNVTHMKFRGILAILGN